MTRVVDWLADVGGSSVKSNVAWAGTDVPRLLLPEHIVSPMPSSGTVSEMAEAVRHHAREVEAAVRAQLDVADDPAPIRVRRLAMAFPGPADYARGIPHMRGIGKYEAIYGLPLQGPLTALLREACTTLDVPKRLPVILENDARLFTLGAYRMDGLATDRATDRYNEAASDARVRVLGLTLGTGCGSGFLLDGRLLTAATDTATDAVPPEGYVYPLMLPEGRVDDVLSARGLLAMARHEGLELKDAAALAPAADGGDPRALTVYRRFGRQLEILIFEVLAGFGADIIYLGGRISRSFAHMAAGFRMPERAARIRVVDDTSGAAMIGAGCWAMREDGDAR